MTLPKHLEKFLQTEQGPVEAERVSSTQSDTEPRVRMALLNDTLGRYRVIFPDNAMVDVDRLNQSLGRELRALSLKEIGRLRQKHQMREIAPLPAITHFETAVDEEVASLSRIRFYSGQGDEDLVLTPEAYQALLGRIHRFPFTRALTDIPVNVHAPEQDEAQLRSALKNFTGLRIRQRLDDTLEIPPLPETAQRILHLRMNPNAEIGQLADIVEADPSLAAQVVSWASSSFYAAQTPVKSIYDAIQRVLGFDLVMNLAMGLALGRTLEQPRDQAEGYVGYWTQAIWMAQATSVIIAMMPRRERPVFGLAYLGGLLHNFGYLVLAHVFPPHFSLMCRYTEVNRHVDNSYVEHHLLGITREQIGGTLMDLWNMPEEVTAAIRHQKNPDYQGEHAIYANALYLARALLIERGIPLGPPMTVPESLYERLNLSPERLGEELDVLLENADSVRSMAGMLSSA